MASATGEDGDAKGEDATAYGIELADIGALYLSDFAQISATFDLSAELVNSGALLVTASATASATGDFGDARGEDATAFGIQVDDIGNLDLESLGEGTAEMALINTGALTVSATASASATGEDGDAYAASAYAYGIDAGTIGESGMLDNSGAITVSASVDASATGEGAEAYAGEVSAYGITTENVNGELINSGALMVTASATASTTGDDGLTTVSGVSAVGIDVGEYAGEFITDFVDNTGEISGVVNNSGEITVTASSVVSAMGEGGEISGGEVSAYGMRAAFTSGDLVNSGSVTVSATSEEGEALAAGVVSVVSGGIGELGEDAGDGIANNGSILVEADGRDATAIGMGFILGVDEDAGEAALVSNTGSIEVVVTAEEDAFATGIFGELLFGAMESSGSIEVVATGGSDADATGIFSEALFGEIESSGEITVDATAVTGRATSTGIEVIFGEDVEAPVGAPPADVVSLVDGDPTGSSITNTGEIMVRASGATSAEATGIAVGEIDGDIHNTGDIVVSASGSDAVAFGIAVGFLDGDLTNSATISASAVSDSGDALGAGIAIFELEGDITNSGTVLGGGNVLSLDVRDGVGSIENTASGELIGGFIVGANDVSFENRGLIDIGTSVGSTDGEFTNYGSGLLALTANSISDHGVFNFTNAITNLNGDGEAATMVVDATNFIDLTTSTVIEDVIVYSAGYDQTDTLYDVTVNETSYLLTFEAVKDVNTLDLVAVIDHMNEQGVTQTLNRHGWTTGKGAGDRLEDLIENPSIVNVDLQEYLNSLVNESDEMTVLQAAQDNTPLMSGAATLALRDSMRLVDRSIKDRVSLSGGMSGGAAITDGTVWLQPFVSNGEQDPNSGAAGYDFDASGVIVGADWEVAEGRTVGIAFANQRVDVDAVNGPSQGAEIDSLRFVGYGTQMLQPDTQLRGMVDFGSGDVESTRRLAYNNRMAFGEYDLESYHVGLGVDHQLMSDNDLTALISLGVDYSSLMMDAYTEVGAGGLNQHVNSQDVTSLVTSLTGQIDLKIDELYNFTARAGFGYDQINDSAELQSRFDGGGALFSTVGVDPDPVMGSLGLGLEYRNDGFSFSVNLDAVVRGGYKEQGASMRWLYEL